jgi:ankyrin repeat protein
VEGWRPENPEEAVLSACSSLIAIINDHGSKIVQFSHFSVKEYMTSNRLQTSDIGHLSDYHIPLEPAHTLLARACMAVLFQLDEKVDREQVATFPLADYTSKRWLDHVKFENVQSQIQNDLKHLFNPKRPHLRACIWVHDMDVKYNPYRDAYSAAKQPPPLRVTPLYYAAFCGFSELAKWLIMAHAEDVNAKCYDDRTPLHVASQEGHVDAVHVLLDHGAYVNPQDNTNWMPLHFASSEGHLEVVQLLLEHEATLNPRNIAGSSPVYLASQLGHLEVVQLLGGHGADVHIRGFRNLTPFQVATQKGHHDVAQLLLEFGAKRRR